MSEQAMFPEPWDYHGAQKSLPAEMSHETQPDDLVTLSEAASYLGYADARALRRRVADLGLEPVDTVERRNKITRRFSLCELRQHFHHQTLDRPPGWKELEEISAPDGTSGLVVGTYEAWRRAGKPSRLKLALKEYRKTHPESLPSRYTWNGTDAHCWTETQVDQALTEHEERRGHPVGGTGFFHKATGEWLQGRSYWEPRYKIHHIQLSQYLETIGAAPTTVRQLSKDELKHEYFSRHSIHAAILERESLSIGVSQPDVNPVTRSVTASVPGWALWIQRNHQALGDKLRDVEPVGYGKAQKHEAQEAPLYTLKQILDVDPEVLEPPPYIALDGWCCRSPHGEVLIAVTREQVRKPINASPIIARYRGHTRTYYRLDELKAMLKPDHLEAIEAKAKDAPTLEENPAVKSARLLKELEARARIFTSKKPFTASEQGNIWINGRKWQIESTLLENDIAGLEDLDQQRAHWQAKGYEVRYEFVVWPRYWQKPIFMPIYSQTRESKELPVDVQERIQAKQRERQREPVTPRLPCLSENDASTFEGSIIRPGSGWVERYRPLLQIEDFIWLSRHRQSVRALTRKGYRVPCWREEDVKWLVEQKRARLKELGKLPEE